MVACCVFAFSMGWFGGRTKILKYFSSELWMLAKTTTLQHRRRRPQNRGEKKRILNAMSNVDGIYELSNICSMELKLWQKSRQDLCSCFSIYRIVISFSFRRRISFTHSNRLTIDNHFLWSLGKKRESFSYIRLCDDDKKSSIPFRSFQSNG